MISYQFLKVLNKKMQPEENLIQTKENLRKLRKSKGNLRKTKENLRNQMKKQRKRRVRKGIRKIEGQGRGKRELGQEKVKEEKNKFFAEE